MKQGTAMQHNRILVSIDLSSHEGSKLEASMLISAPNETSINELINLIKSGKANLSTKKIGGSSPLKKPIKLIQ
jgi:hypothetical protein